MNTQRSNAIVKIVESGEQAAAIGLLHDYVKETESKIHNHNDLCQEHGHCELNELIIDRSEYAVYVNTCKLFGVDPLKPIGWSV
jgi:hypothetical protein